MRSGRREKLGVRIEQFHRGLDVGSLERGEVLLGKLTRRGHDD
jgi:hypothetical protein